MFNFIRRKTKEYKETRKKYKNLFVNYKYLDAFKIVTKHEFHFNIYDFNSFEDENIKTKRAFLKYLSKNEKLAIWDIYLETIKNLNEKELNNYEKTN